MGIDRVSNQGNKRILVIDVLRGIALLGIFLVNIFAFHTPYLYVDQSTLAESRMDKFIFSMIDIFIQASFYPLFAMLFGYGLIMIKEKTELRNHSFHKIACKRMLILLMFGFSHAFLIWPGDILISYAIFGFVFILFTKLSSRAMVITAILLYCVPNLLLLIVSISMNRFLDSEMSIFNAEKAREVANIYQNGSFIEITIQRIDDWYFQTGSGLIVLFMIVFPLFLFGGSLAKTKRLETNEKNFKFWKIILIIFLPVGLLMKTAPYIFGGKNMTINYIIQDLFGGVCLTFVYFAMIYLLCTRKRFNRVFTYLANIGKMSLSNYIFQSMICSFIFYSYGLGLYGEVSYTESFLIALIIYCIQLIICYFLSKKHKNGPLEWLWRRLIYGKVLDQASVERRKV